MMNESFVEVKSALWQKIVAAAIFGIIGGAGVACLLSPFLPIFAGPQPPIFLPLLTGAFLFALGFGPLWATMRYQIRADENGISQTNGFFRQTEKWSEVQSYYVAINPRFYKSNGRNYRNRYDEPFLLNAYGDVIFQGFAHIFVSTEAIFRQRQNLWDFVEVHLAGKKIDAPVSELDAEKIALESLEVNWKEKSAWWIFRRILALLLYTAFWMVIGFSPIFIFLSRYSAVRPPVWFTIVAVVCFSFMCIGPILPHIIWLYFKKKKVLRELQRCENEKVGD